LRTELVSGRAPSVLPKGRQGRGKKVSLGECYQEAWRVRARREDTEGPWHS
jgi:hypothetical protein